MTVRWLLAFLHLLALGIGLGAIWARARGLRGPLDRNGLRTVFAADTFWGVAAAIWVITGLIRAFAGYEKGTDYYIHNGAFLLKMALLIVIITLEIFPMMTLMQWRSQVGRNEQVDTAPAAAMARISLIQVVLAIVMVMAATAMARGLGGRVW